MPCVELSQKVSFHAVHRLHRDVAPAEAASSMRIHGHDYEAEACIRTEVDSNGMAMDQTDLRHAIRAVVKQFEGIVLDDIPGLGPATVENMAIHLWTELHRELPLLHWVAIGRQAHGDRAVYRG